ncbi:ADP-heptose:LPS heptosyltransferase [Thiovulum sp. ES]|nr:ADP-heptose:LPS heptosyltransferase [Thiovulum sp. ES]
MRILVETPTWLGDTVMLTPSLLNLEKSFPRSEIYIVGSPVAMQILEGFGKKRISIGRKNRFGEIRRVSREIGKVDISLSFRTSPFSGMLQLFSGAKERVAIGKPLNSLFLTKSVKPEKHLHQVEKYLEIVKSVIGEVEKFPQKLRFEKKLYKKPTLGINAGATYGSAKRWYPKKFAEVIANLSDKYETVLFGGKGEIDIVSEIENLLIRNGITNFINLAGKTSVSELAELIGGLDLFITNDSGPMHIAGAFGVPTVSIFGSTNHIETNQWKNEKSEIVRKNLECSPCMKRECPLKHHDCMKSISADEVVQNVFNIT